MAESESALRSARSSIGTILMSPMRSRGAERRRMKGHAVCGSRKQDRHPSSPRGFRFAGKEQYGVTGGPSPEERSW